MIRSQVVDKVCGYAKRRSVSLGGEPARVQVRRPRACEVERPLYDPGAKKKYRSKF